MSTSPLSTKGPWFLMSAKTTSRAAQLDPIVRERLVCPQDVGPLLDAGDELYNPRLRVAYRIDDDGIAVMLADEARAVDEAEHQRLIG